MAPSTLAATFPDVPDSHPYADAIRELVLMEVVKGRPDGKFYPEEPINRADFLVLIYRALRRTPAGPEKICKKDVVPGAYYETIVCHALGQGFVSGYGDGTFQPGKTITRSEGIKMLLKVLEFNLSARNAKDAVPPSLIDVPLSEWFYNYVIAAYAKHILPIRGWEGSSFFPGKELTRGEAAALISTALKAREIEYPHSQSSSSSESSSGDSESSDSDTPQTIEEKREEQREKLEKIDEAASKKPAVTLKQVSFPFTDTQSGKNFTHSFTLSAKTTASVVVTLGDKGKLTSCTLSRIEKDGFTLEYYRGYLEGKSCEFLVTLMPGSYQLRTQTTFDDASFTVTATAGKGDGNDGFAEASSLNAKSLRTDLLGAGTIANYYSFNVAKSGSMTLKLISTKELVCIIYPLANVDVYGFSGPECNKAYEYAPGDYIVAVMRNPATLVKAASQVYTVQWGK